MDCKIEESQSYFFEGAWNTTYNHGCKENVTCDYEKHTPMFFYSICYKAYENQRIFDDNVDNKGPKTLGLTHG